MVDTELLEQKIIESGKKIGYLAEKLGISRQYFRMKCKNKADFTNRETDILCDELSITTLTEKEKFSLKSRQKRKQNNGGESLNDLQILNVDGIECYEKDGTAYLKLETVARGLGFTREKNGTLYVMWDRVMKYLAEIGFHTCAENGVPTCGHDDFIPENIFYRLAMKAKNEVAERFQAKVADEIIPSIRKHGGYIAGQEAMSDDELLAKALVVAQSKIAEKQKHIEELTKEVNVKNQVIGELKPKADYTDKILKTRGL